MTRLLLAAFLLLPAVLMAQDTTDCATQEGLQYDLDGDMLVGAGDLVQFLSWFNTNFDVDQDGVLDCEDECVGEYDECGVCNGLGPQVLAIDTIIITYDSVYVEAIDDWVVYELGTDTLFSMVCGELEGCNSWGGLVYMDGYNYSTVLIGDQCWFAENLRTTVYANGDVISAGLTDSEWTSTTLGATAVYGSVGSYCTNDNTDFDACDDAQSLIEYGRLYNWYAVDDERGLCPSGWHVPTDGEWTELENYITSQGFDGTEGVALKSTTGWYNGGNGTDDFGFSALPGGFRSFFDGHFHDAGSSGYWWSSSQSGDLAYYRKLYSWSGILRGYYGHEVGSSVRCLRDAE